MKQEQKLAASSITCLLWRHKVCREHFVCFVSPERYYFRGDRTKAINKSYPQIFLKFDFYLMIDMSWKKFIFLHKPFFSFFIIQVLVRFFLLEFYTIASGYLDHHRKRKFMLISIETRHRCLASRSRFIHGFKMFLSINSVYIGIFDFFQEIVNLD